jgi:hypothetical protein
MKKTSIHHSPWGELPMKAPLPGNETERLAALRGLGILDTPPELAYDELSTLAAHICQTPIALISLVDEGRQWFKSRVGWTAGETPREVAVCQVLDRAANELGNIGVYTDFVVETLAGALAERQDH